MRKSALGFAVLVGLGVTAVCARVGRAAQQGALPGPQDAAAKSASQPSAQLALSLIQSAVEAARSIDPASKAIVFLMAGRAVRTLEPRKALAYFDDSFEAGENIEGSNLHSALQPIIVDWVADLDLDRAVDLVEKMDTPEITAQPDVDNRVVTAGAIAAKLLARNDPNDPDEAVGLLEYLGDTGQYPYQAAGQLIGFFHKKGEDWRAVDVFTSAMGYYREDDRFQGTSREFIDLIRASESKVPPNVLVSALRLCTRAIRDAIASRDMTDIDRKLRHLGGSHELISELLMIADPLDPQSASELRELSTKLHDLNAQGTSPGSKQEEFARITGAEPKPREPVESGEGTADAQQALQAVRTSAAKDPAAALTRAEAIQVPEYQSQALAIVAKHLSAREKAIPILEEAARAADQMDPAQAATSLAELTSKMTTKVEALAEIADAWEQWGEEEKASASLGKAFAWALELFQRQAALKPGAASGFGSSSYLLARLARVEARVDPARTAERAQAISDPRLRAFFLISMATEILKAT